jgi:AraC family transcriptional activator of tynA and feaB
MPMWSSAHTGMFASLAQATMLCSFNSPAAQQWPTTKKPCVSVSAILYSWIRVGRLHFFAGHAGESWNTMALVLPRQALVSHLGFEPRGGLHRRNGTVVGRLLLDLIRNAGEEEVPPLRTECYVRLAVHDLVGALFAPSDPAPARHSDKLFMRVRGVIKDGFVDPDLDPSEVATRAGISLRYLQKLFTERGSTCSEFIYSFRLDYAAHLLRRQCSLGASQALREIACASGFRDYSHFARRFRQRFGHAPGAHLAGGSCDREGVLNACG